LHCEVTAASRAHEFVSTVSASHNAPGSDDVIYLQNHLHQLGGKHQLLLLANQGLDDVLLTHVCAIQTRAGSRRIHKKGEDQG
jgi:hypothetical protein